MDIFAATRSYEAWLAAHAPVLRGDLRLKHARMAESPFVFLRATFYRWIQRWPDVCPALADAPSVLAVGDAHIENFGTWRDVEGRLVWGLNDVDEACALPYTQDLVRLAASAVLARRGEHLALSKRGACDAILDGYTASIERGGQPIVLAERRRWLRQIALTELRDPTAFWDALHSLPPATGRIPHQALRALFPAPHLTYRAVRRTAGVGSLGKPRVVALADWGGGFIAREAKALVPSAWCWASGRPAAVRCDALLHGAVRVPDPFFAVHGEWIVRRLAPDCTRIEVADLPNARAGGKLLRAMGWEIGNLHVTSRRTVVRADLARRPERWLEEAAVDMAEVVTREWRAWRRRRG